MRINTQINIFNMKLHTPEYYILMHNIIDCSINLVQARYILDNKYRVLSKEADDIELQRMYRLYKLFHVCKHYNKLNASLKKIDKNEEQSDISEYNEDEEDDTDEDDEDKYKEEIEKNLHVIERPSILRLITNHNSNTSLNCGRNYGVRY